MDDRGNFVLSLALMATDDRRFRPPKEETEQALELETEEEIQQRISATRRYGSLPKSKRPRKAKSQAELLETQDEFLVRVKQESARQQLMPLKLLIPLTLGLLALVAWEISATVLQHRDAITADHWQAAVTALQKKRKSAEPILVAPAWARPMAYQALGKRMTLDLATLSNVDRFSRVWQLSIRGKTHPWLKSLKATDTEHVGPIQLSLFERPAIQAMYNFTKRWRTATVGLSELGAPITFHNKANVESKNQNKSKRNRKRKKSARARQQAAPEKHANPAGWTPCPQKADRFLCDPKRGWNHVRPFLAEVAHEPYRCLYAHPVEGKALRISFQRVPHGNSLVVYTGIDHFDNRKHAKAPVSFRVFVDTEEVSRIEHQNDWPWHRHTISVPAPRSAGNRHQITFEVTAEKAYRRVFCFHAELQTNRSGIAQEQATGESNPTALDRGEKHDGG